MPISEDFSMPRDTERGLDEVDGLGWARVAYKIAQGTHAHRSS